MIYQRVEDGRFCGRAFARSDRWVKVGRGIWEADGGLWIEADIEWEALRILRANHTIEHPEIGLVLDSQCGAQSEGCAYDTPERSEEAAPAWLKPILAENRAKWAHGNPGTITAVLASDGWWWRIV